MSLSALLLLHGVLFLAPFVDPRRPTRLLHLDLLILLGFSAIYMREAEQALGATLLVAAKLLIVLGIVYVIARMLFEGFHGGRRREPLVPLVPLRWLVVGLSLVVVFRACYTLIDEAPVIDVGGAGVVGADLLTHGGGIYEGEISSQVPHGETYGPVNYLFYIPFEQAIPLEGDWRDADAARVAAIAFDLLTVLALLVVGRRLRPGREGVALGVALAYAWATYPYTFYTLRFAFNDALLAALMVGALIAVAHPVRRGAVLGLAAATKFVPIALAPLFARGVGPLRARSAALFAVTFAAVLILAFLPFLPDGGLGELYDRTLGFQASGERCCSVWEQPPYLDLTWLVWPARVVAAALALLVAIGPPAATARQLAARAAAVMAAVVLAAPLWSPVYAVWFVPFVFIALFAVDKEGSPSG
jgi:Glycosyltransferase family 87